MSTPKRLVVGITAPGSVNLLRGQLKYFYEQGFITYLAAPDDPKTRAYTEQEHCTLLPVAIERDISLLRDLTALWTIFKHFRKVQPDIVNVGTPKMGLLGTLAGALTGVRKRIYTCRGFRYEHESGIKRKILMLMEWITARFAHQIICISPSVKSRGVADGVFNLDKCIVINKGSSNGIDLSRFNPALIKPVEQETLTADLRLEGHFVYGFVGRLIDRKGIAELYEAFEQVCKENSNSRLLIVGPLEFEQITDKTLVQKLQEHPAVFMPGRTDNVPLYLSLMDVFVLPAWWEGFGNVLTEAAAMGVPVISTTGTGTVDAVSAGYNGILVPVKDSKALEAAMIELLTDTAKREKMGENGKQWALNFDREIIWEGMLEIYQS